MSTPTLRLTTERLELSPLSDAALDALIRGDGVELATLTGARFPDPVVAPPLMEDALAFMRDRLRADPGEANWWAWLIVEASTREAVGSLGFGGRPDTDGAVTLGYAIYPAFKGRGFATEAARALVAWALGQPGVGAVRATIPVGHTPSLRVAEKAGMRRIGRDRDDEVGELLVLEARSIQEAASR